MGFDSLRWLPDCSNELNHYKLNILSEELKRSNIKISPSHYSFFHYPEKKQVEIIRRIYKVDEEIKQEDLKTKKAVSIMKLDKNTVGDIDLLTNKIKKISESFKSKIEIDKISIIPTNSKKEFQFTLFDHIKTHRGNKTGYSVVTNASTQVTDVTQEIESPIHMEISLTESINLLNLMGCTIDTKLFPIYDAPNDEILDKIRKNIDRFTIKYNYSFEDYSSLRLGSLFFGTTATSNTHKELPNRYDLIEEDMDVIITDKLGLLSCLSLYIITKLDEKLFEKLSRADIDEEKINRLKDQAIKNLVEPRISLGKIISKFLPNFEESFNIQSHIPVTHPVSKNGVSSLNELSKLINKEILIDKIPFEDKNIVDFVSKELLIVNPTASTSNTNIIILSKELSSSVIEGLSKSKFNPEVIGKIGKSGRSGILFNDKEK